MTSYGNDDIFIIYVIIDRKSLKSTNLAYLVTMMQMQ